MGSLATFAGKALFRAESVGRRKSQVGTVDRVAATTVIFDADDTLWDTQPLYEKSKHQFFSLMQKAGFPKEDAAARLETRDHANVAKLGFSKDRFPISMRDTYRTLCSAYSRQFNEDMALRAMEIGRRVFKESPNVFEGVVQTLSELRRRGVRLLLATKGDPEVQSLRIDVSGLRSYFDRVYVMKNKDATEFRDLVSEEHIEVSHGWSVGNSARSDINPALAVGLHAIWIPRETWSYEKVKPLENRKLHVVQSVVEVPKIVLNQH